MNETQKTILDLTSATLFGRDVHLSEGCDWQAVYDEIRQQSLVSLLFPLTSDLDIPDDVMSRWSDERDRYILNNAKVIGGHFGIQKLMDEAAIPCLILKGLASAKYYPDYLLRAFGDVDFLVPEDEYKKATELLKNSGFKFVNLHDKHRIYSRHDVIYELHRDIVGVPEPPLDEIFDRYFQDLFEDSVPFEHRGSHCMTPSDRHHAVILLIHTAYHLAHTGVGLRHICDWAAFVHRMPDGFFKKDMQPVLKRMGIWHFAGVLTCLCTKYLGLRKCPWAEEAPEEHLEEMIDDVFGSGEFGRIREEAASEGRETGTDSSDMLRPETLKAFLASIDRGAKTVIPAAAKNPILLPAGWAFVAARYAARILAGKRTAAKAKENIVRLGRRQELTREWRLFEKEDDDPTVL